VKRRQLYLSAYFVVLQKYCTNGRSTSIIQRPWSKHCWCGAFKVLLCCLFIV